MKFDLSRLGISLVLFQCFEVASGKGASSDSSSVSAGSDSGSENRSSSDGSTGGRRSSFSLELARLKKSTETKKLDLVNRSIMFLLCFLRYKSYEDLETMYPVVFDQIDTLKPSFFSALGRLGLCSSSPTEEEEKRILDMSIKDFWRDFKKGFDTKHKETKKSGLYTRKFQEYTKKAEDARSKIEAEKKKDQKRGRRHGEASESNDKLKGLERLLPTINEKMVYYRNKLGEARGMKDCCEQVQRLASELLGEESVFGLRSYCKAAMPRLKAKILEYDGLLKSELRSPKDRESDDRSPEISPKREKLREHIEAKRSKLADKL